MIRGVDPEPLIVASGWINNEVGEGLVEGSDRVVDVLLEGEERVYR